jgi:4-diphosphocytidyl-2-C-methyl-D-erythritol kinase
VIETRAFAKVTLSLRVSPPVESGLHPIAGRFQSIRWSDQLKLGVAEEDTATTSDGGAIIDGMRNLAWSAVAEVRQRAVSRPPLELTLDKSIPIAAGLGGGSADAAAALASAGALLGVDRSALSEIAPALGSDVPFCYSGGAARVGGIGERVDELPALTGFALGLVVPPIEVSTPAVYRRWDELNGPSGPTLRATAVPPAVRDEPIVNDLTPAAIAEAPEIGEWRGELEHRWSRPVALAGSGPTLFAFFVDHDEAEAAVGAIPAGARDARAAIPVDFGWTLRIGETDRVVDSKGRQVDSIKG